MTKHNLDIMDSVDQIFKDFGLPLPAVPKDDEALPGEQIQAREEGSGRVLDSTVP